MGTAAPARRARRIAGGALALALTAGGIGSVAAAAPVPRVGPVTQVGSPTQDELRRLPASMAALGDSITTGFNACGFYVDCRRRSWSTGDDDAVLSHRTRLIEAGARLSEETNLARRGARVEALAGQAERAVAAGVDYLTVEIGANDVCRGRVAEMTPVEAFGGQLRAGLAELRRGLPQARVFLASVPDVHRLWEVGHRSHLARLAWDKLDICQSLLARPTSAARADVDRRAAVRDRVVAYNREIAAACAEYGPRCRYDGDAVFAARFTLDQLTRWDFFHPDKSGQRALADATWRASFFA